MKKSYIVLTILVVLGAILRFYNLAGVPVALNGDEAGFGYNAFSILHSLRDEHGNFLPMVFKSFGDYKPPVLVYMLVPIIKVFGLTEFAVRLPVALAGTGIIVLTYLIAKKLYESEKIALMAAFFVTISPWAIIFSRGAWEAGIGLFFTTLAIYFYLLSRTRKVFFWISLVTFIIAFYSYHAEKVAVPLLIGTCFWLYPTFKGMTKRTLLVGGLTIFIFALPALIGITNISGQSRAKGSLITDYFHFSTKDDTYRLTQHVDESSGFITNTVNHARIGLTFTDMASKFLAYLSPAQLFVYGDEVGRHSIIDLGTLYEIDFLFLGLAVYFFIKKQKTKADYFLLLWLFIGLLPAMITKDRLHTIRPLLALPALYIFMAPGLIHVYNALKQKSKIWLGISSLVAAGFLVFCFMRFVQSYFIITPIENAFWWQYGYKEMVQEVAKHQDRFDKVVVKSPELYGNPYIFFLFYQRFDPTEYNRTVQREDIIKKKVTEVYGFSKYTFRDIYWPKDRYTPKTLYVGTAESLPKNDIENQPDAKVLKEITLPDGEVILRVVETL